MLNYTKITRKASVKFGLALSAATVAAVAFVGVPARVWAKEPVLKILTWEGLANDSWVKPFEEKYHVKVDRTYVGSNDEYMAKLAAGDIQYDMVVIVSSLAQPAIRAGFVEPVNLKDIPNFKKIYPAFQNLNFERHNGKQYGIPNDWDILPVTVNSNVVKHCSFGVLFNKKYKGKIAMWDDVATLGTVAAYMGFHNIWNLNKSQLNQVKKKMIAQKPLIRTYWSTGGQIIQLFRSGEVVATDSWSYVTRKLKDEGMNVTQCTPKHATAFLDADFVVKGTHHKELVEKFINYLISPKVAAQVYKASGFGVTDPSARKHLPKGALKGSVMDKGAEFRRNINFWKEIPNRGQYLHVWNEVKAASVK